MPYASLPDVNALCPARTFTATSIPSASQVAQMLAYTTTDLDSIMAADGYGLPVPTGASIALQALRRLTALGAWAQVEQAAQESPNKDRAIAEWQAAVKDFKSGGVSLYDLPRLGGENYARAQFAPTPFFTRDMALARQPRDARPAGWRWRGR